MSGLEFFFRVAMAIPMPMKRLIGMPLRLLPSFRRQLRVFKFQRDIEKLETASDFDGAQALRKRALQEFAPPFSGAFWRSEGYDRLRRGEQHAALEAFEQGIADISDAWPPDASIADPPSLYYGAALAALQVGEIDRARGHYRTLRNLISEVAALFPRTATERSWAESLETLGRQLGDA